MSPTDTGFIVHVTQTRWGYVMFDTQEKANAFIDDIENSEEPINWVGMEIDSKSEPAPG